MNPLSLLIGTIAAFFGAGHIPISAALKVALATILAITGGIVGSWALTRFGVDPVLSAAISIFAVVSILKAWASRMNHEKDSQ